MNRWKAEMGRAREKRRAEERRSEKRKSQKKEDAGARKVRKVVKHCVFPMICGSGGSKSRLAKAAGAEPAGQMRDAYRFPISETSATALCGTTGTWSCSCSCSCLSICLSASFKTKLFCETSSGLVLFLTTSKTEQFCETSSIFELDNLTTSKTKQFCETSSVFELDNIKNGAILRDFLNFWTWQLDNIKSETILRDFLVFRSWQHQKRNNSARRPSKMESWVQTCRPRANAFCDFSNPPG